MIRAARNRLAAVPTYQRALALYMVHSLIMSTLTVSGLQVALPSIMSDFNIPVTTAAWISIAYFVALAGGTMTLGGITTMMDRRKLIVIGIAADIVVMMITFFTHDIYVVIVCRFLSAAFRVFPWLILQVEGIGGFPPEKRGKAVGYSTITMGLGLLVALPLTGWFVDHVGWRYMFLTASVLYVFFIPVVIALLPSLKPNPATRKPLAEFDFAGAGLMMIGTVSLITALQVFARGLADSSLIIVLAGTGIVAILGFIWTELHARSPVLAFSLFRDHDVFMASTQSVIMGFMNGSMLLMLPFLFINGFGWTAGYASNLLLFQNITRPAAGPAAGRLADRYGSAAVILPAAAISLVGQIGLSNVGVSPSMSFLIGALLLWGSGLALMQTANLRQVYAALPQSHLHLAPSLNLVVSTLGSTLGQAIGSLIVEHTRNNATNPAGYVHMVNRGIFAITVFFAIGMVVTQVLPRLLLRERRDAVPELTMATEPDAATAAEVR